MDRDSKITFAICSGLAALGIALLFWAARAEAHEWYSSTNDPETGFGCCGGNDCDEIDEADVKEVKGGVVYLPTNEFIPEQRVQQSRDYRYHRCVYLGSFTNSRTGESYEQGDTRCFFRPPGMS